MLKVYLTPEFSLSWCTNNLKQSHDMIIIKSNNDFHSQHPYIELARYHQYGSLQN